MTVLPVYTDTQNKMTILWMHSHSDDIHIYSFSEHVYICGATQGSVHFIQELSTKGLLGSLMTSWWVGDPPLAQQAAPFFLIHIMLKKLICMMRVVKEIKLNGKDL